MIRRQLVKSLKKALKPVLSVVLAVAVVLTGIPLYPGDFMGRAHAATINVHITPPEFNNVYGGEANIFWDYQDSPHETLLQTCEVTPWPVIPPPPPGPYDPPTYYNRNPINTIKTVNSTSSKSYTEPWNGNYNISNNNEGTPAKEGKYTVCAVPSGAEQFFYFADVTINNPAPPAPKYIFVDPGTDRFATKHKIRGVAERGTEVSLDIQYIKRDDKDLQVPDEHLQASIIVPFDNEGNNDGSHLTWAKDKDFSQYFTNFPFRDDNKPEKYVREWEYELELHPYEIAQITTTVKRLNTNPYYNTENDAKNQSSASKMVKFLRYVAPGWDITWEALAGYYYKTESLNDVVEGSEKIAKYNLTEHHLDDSQLQVCKDTQICPGPITQNWNLIIPEPKLAGKISREEYNNDLKFEQITNNRGFNVPKWWDPINLATGDFSFHHTNISLQAVMPLEFGVTYHSRDTYDGAIGYGWHHTYEWRLEFRENGNLYLITPDGAAYLYTPNANGNYTTPAGTYGHLSKLADGTYQLDMPQGLSYLFREDGMLYRIQDRNGNQTKLSYNKTILTKVETEGASLTFDYMNGGKIATVTDQANRKVIYEYDELNHDLLSISLPDKGTIRFRYNKKHQLEEIDNPNHTSTLVNQYDDQGRVIHQRDFYGSEGDVQYFPDQHKTVTTDPLGRSKTFEYDERFRQTAMYYPDGTVERFEYDENDNLKTKIDQRGNKWGYLYDNNGNLLQTSDPLGHITSIHYNSWNKPDEIIDALGNKTKIGYDDKGNMTSITNQLEETSIIHRDSRGVPTGIENPNKEYIDLKNDNSGFAEWIIDPLGNRQHLVRDSLHRVTDVVDALNHITKLEYDDRDRVKIKIDALQQREEFDYDKDSNLTYHKDASGAETRMDYEFNRVKTITDALNQKTTFDYDKVGNLVEKIAPNGARTKYTYNSVNRMDKMIVFDLDESGNEIQIVTEFRYDDNGNLIWRKDPKGNITEIHYDERNLPDWIQDPSGAKTSFVYDALGRLEQETNALGKSTTYHYDEAGRLNKIKDAMGNEISYAFDKAGRLEKVTRPNGAVWQMQYDARGLLVGTTDPLGKTTVLERNELGQVKVSKDASGAATKYSYDKLGRVEAIINALDHSTSISYDPVGRVKSILDANNHTTDYDYDALGRLKSVTNALQATTFYDYDPVGNITSKTDAMGRITGYRYNLRNMLTQENNPMNEVTKLGHDANGNLTSILYPDSQTTSYNYDVVNRLTQILYPDNKQVNYTYDELGRRKTMADSTGTTSYAYDALNRLTQVTNGANQTIGYEWTSTGQRSKVVYPDQSTVSYEYDLLDRMTKVTDGQGLSTTYNYDARGQVVEKKLPTLGGSTYRYDAIGQLLELKQTNQYGKIVDQMLYAYDPVGNRVLQERKEDGNDEDDADSSDHPESQVSEYAYDALNQLKQVKQYNQESTSVPSITTYDYDAVGNRLTKQSVWDTLSMTEQYTYDAADKLTHWQSGSSYKDYSYDLRGNLLKVIGVEQDDEESTTLNSLLLTQSTVSGGVYNTIVGNTYGSFSGESLDSNSSQTPEILEQYFWNSANRLEKQINPKKDVLQYLYDGDGNRTKMTIDVKRGPNDKGPGNGQGQGNGNGNGNNNGNGKCHVTPPGFIPPGLVKKCGQYEEPYPDMHPGGPREGWEKQFQKKHWEFNYTNDVSLALPEPLMVTDKSGLSGPSDYYTWKQTYAYGAGGERISMTYLPAYDANNGWDPHDGTAGAEPGVAPRTLYYLNDALGSAVGLIEKDGRVSARYHYDEFGIPTDAKKFDVNWPGPDNLFGYTGLGYDYYSGLSYARARYYQPEIGRFISEDTYKGNLWNPQSQNGYAYVHNNPIRYIDPSGYYCVSKDGNNAHGGKCSNEDSYELGDDSLYIGREYIEDGVALGTIQSDGTVDYFVSYDLLPYSMNYWDWDRYGNEKDKAEGINRYTRAWAAIGMYGMFSDEGAAKTPLMQRAIARAEAAAVAKGASSLFERGTKVLNNFNIDDAYVKTKHLSTTGGNGAKFLGDTKAEAEEILKNTMKNGNVTDVIDNGLTKQGNQSYEIIVDAGKEVGTRGETSVKIILSEDGAMLSAYPIK